jgi:hypothetical protein
MASFPVLGFLRRDAILRAFAAIAFLDAQTLHLLGCLTNRLHRGRAVHRDAVQ